jgi:putative hydrolase of the HAD superfamily
MHFTIRAITLDLDDTIWPFAPIGARIEQVLDDWLRIHSPRTAERFPITAMRALREQVFEAHPHLLHDISALRRLTLQRAFLDSDTDPSQIDTLTDAAYAVFYAERNRVECYPDALDALARISAKLPVAALSNGNADLVAIGLDQHFAFQLGAREHGAAKPEASIFHAACVRLELPPEQVLHVGDHAVMDAAGAMHAGLRAAWLNREGAPWPLHEPQPDLEFSTLTALADWLDAHLDDKDSAAA